MSIIDTSSWIDAALAGQRYRLADEDQRLQRDSFDLQRDRLRQRDEQERNDQALMGSLWDIINGQQPGTSTPPTDYTNGPPTMQEMQARQAQPAMPAGGMGPMGQTGQANPRVRELLGRASPQAGSRFMDDYRLMQGQFSQQRRQLETQNQKQQLATVYEPLIRSEFKPERVPDAMALLDTFVNSDMTPDQFRRGLRQMQDDDRSRETEDADRAGLAFELAPRTGTESDFFVQQPDHSRMSPEALARVMADRRMREMQGQRQDFSRGMQEDRQQHGAELTAMRANRPPRPRSTQMTPEQIASQFPALAQDAPFYAQSYNGRDLNFSDLQQENTRRSSNPRLPSLSSDPVYIDLNNQVGEWEDEVKYLDGTRRKDEADAARNELYKAQANRSKYLNDRAKSRPTQQPAPATVPTGTVNARMGDGSVVPLDEAAITRIIDEELARGGSDAEVADRVQRRIKAGG